MNNPSIKLEEWCGSKNKRLYVESDPQADLIIIQVGCETILLETSNVKVLRDFLSDHIEKMEELEK